MQQLKLRTDQPKPGEEGKQTQLPPENRRKLTARISAAKPQRLNHRKLGQLSSNHHQRPEAIGWNSGGGGES